MEKTRKKERKNNGGRQGNSRRGEQKAAEAFIFSQEEDVESCGNSWCDPWDESCGLSECASVTWTGVLVVTDVRVSSLLRDG